MPKYYIPTKEEIRQTRRMADMTQVEASEVCMLTPTSWSRYEQGVNTMPAYIWKLFTMVLAEKERLTREAEEEAKRKQRNPYAFELKAEKAEQERLEAEEKEAKYQAMLEKAHRIELQRREEFRPTLDHWKDMVRIKVPNVDQLTKADTEDYDGMVRIARQLEKFYHDYKEEINMRIEGTWTDKHITVDGKVKLLEDDEDSLI